MNRLSYYSLSFVISLIGFILFHFIEHVDTLIVIIFFVCSLALVFTRENTPNSNESLKIPQVHYYISSRINSYGNYMLAALVTASVLYSILSFYIRPGIVVLALWAFMVVATRIIVHRTQKKLLTNIIIDYISNSLEIAQQSEYLIIQEIIEELFENNTSATQAMLKQKYPDLFDKTYALYSTYTEKIKEKIISDEVEALNEITSK